MPYLRMPEDNSLAETLGNLGSSLRQAFDPMRQIQAQSLLQEQQQRAFELQKARQLDAANANAATVYGNLNPHNLSPADLEVAKSQIRNGQFNPAQTMDALVATSNMTARNAVADLYAANNAGMPPDQLASDVADLRTGRKNYSELTSDRANAVLNTNKAKTTMDETNAAATPASKQAAALGQPETAVQLDAATSLAAQPPITGSLEDPATQQTIDQRTIQRGVAKIPVTPDMPVSSGLAAPAATAKLVQQSLADQSKAVDPSLIRRAIPPTDPITGLPIAPDTPGGFSQTGSGPDAGAIAQTEGAKTQAHEVAAGDIKVLDSAISESGSAQAMKSKLSQLKDLADALDTSGAGLTSRVLRTLADYNVHPGDIGATYAAIQQIINAEIPDVRQKAGIQRLAGPAIKEEQLILGTANMPKKTLMNIIANEEATADLQISRATLAYQARTGQIPMNDYYQKSLALDATIKEHTNELRNQYKAIGTERTRPADAPVSANPPVPVAPDGTQPAEVFDLKTRKLVPVR